jgi:hypothetical protein
MKRTHRSNRVLCVCVLAAFACEKPKSEPNPEPGRISGTVTTRATAPAPIALPEAVHKVCGEQLADPTVQLGEQGALANAVVWVEDAPSTAAGAAPLLDQKRCAYFPPVLVGHTGGKLKVKNSDPLMHNVRADALFNVGMPIENQVIERPLPATPGPLKIVCDVHPWMRADVMVLPHDQWAVTDLKGHFEIPNVTRGKHAVHVWHATLGEKTMSVDVPPRGEGTVDTTL